MLGIATSYLVIRIYPLNMLNFLFNILSKPVLESETLPSEEYPPPSYLCVLQAHRNWKWISATTGYSYTTGHSLGPEVFH